MKALIIKEPSLGEILRGEKTWEMRKTGCRVRGRIGLIRKGSGQVVGVVDLAGSKAPVKTCKEYAAAEHYHRIPPSDQAEAFGRG